MDAKNYAFGAKLDAVGHRLSKHLDFLIFMHTAMLMLLVAIYRVPARKEHGGRGGDGLSCRAAGQGRRRATTLVGTRELEVAFFASLCPCQRVVVAV